MRQVTTLLFGLLLALPVLAQETDYVFTVPLSEDFESPYSVGIHSGARQVQGPYDLDNDGNSEVLISDYTGGGRVLVIEHMGDENWELAYTTPWLDSTATTGNIRTFVAGDLDGDDFGEIYFLSGCAVEESSICTEFFEDEDLPFGLYGFEFNGTDFGDAPATIYEFNGDPAERWRAEQMAIGDVDGDGDQELLFGNNGSDNRYDNWYILSVTGDIGTGFEVWVEEARLSSRASEDFDPNDRGGGSPYAIHLADLDGNGDPEIVLHSWNNFNITLGDATGANTYDFAADNFFRGYDDDYVSFFGGTVVDINDDGDDEVYFPTLQTGDVGVLNYEGTEDASTITEDNWAFVLEDFATLGITAGDLDNDGFKDLIAGGASYSVDAYMDGDLPEFLRISEFNGGDVEDPDSYSTPETSSFFEPFDTLGVNFDFVMRDSAGVMSEYYEETSFSGKDRAGGIGGQGPVFVSKLAYLGDVDNDGFDELALAFQGVDDSTYVIQETFNPDDSTYTRVIVEARPVENRAFLRIIEGGAAFTVSTQAGEVPERYTLSANYPNPFNPSTAFTFTIPQQEAVTVRVYDVTGRVIKTLLSGQPFTAGTHEVRWDGTADGGAAVASGTYFYSLEWGGQRIARPMVLVK